MSGEEEYKPGLQTETQELPRAPASSYLHVYLVPSHAFNAPFAINREGVLETEQLYALISIRQVYNIAEADGGIFHTVHPIYGFQGFIPPTLPPDVNLEKRIRGPITLADHLRRILELQLDELKTAKGVRKGCLYIHTAQVHTKIKEIVIGAFDYCCLPLSIRPFRTIAQSIGSDDSTS